MLSGEGTVGWEMAAAAGAAAAWPQEGLPLQRRGPPPQQGGGGRGRVCGRRVGKPDFLGVGLAAVLLAATTPAFAVARELKYPDGVSPGDQISGTEGEYYRYKSVLIKPPDDEDRMESLKMSEDIKCRACELLLEGLLTKAESHSEDHIMDQLDGEMLEPPVIGDNPQENRVNSYRKGCNKHFKDELLLKGWIVQRCPEPEDTKIMIDGGEVKEAAGAAEAALPARPAEWCLEQRSSPPTERDVDTYSTRNEAAFYACENTVGRYGQELAAFVAERLEDGGPVHQAIGAACREAARCQGVPRRGKKGQRRRRQAADSEL